MVNPSWILPQVLMEIQEDLTVEMNPIRIVDKIKNE
jgi:hypothetical protein